MKTFAKTLSLVLALLMLVTCFASCGGTTETESETVGEQNTETETVVTETEDPRQAVKDDISKDLTFADTANNTVTFFIRDDTPMWNNEIDVDEITDDSLWDAIYKRNQTVENRLGVTITTIGQPGTWGPHTQWFQTLRNAVSTKSGDFDAASIYISQGAPLALEGMYYNLIDFPHINPEKPWWNQILREETTIFETCFFLAGDIAVSSIAGGAAFFYNKNLFTKLHPNGEVDIYQLVDEGRWTIDKMYDLMENAWEDLNSNGIADDGDVVGMLTGDPSVPGGPLMDAWIPALGLNVTVMEDSVPVLALYNERSVAAFEKVQNLYMNNPSALIGTSSQTSFINGNVLFQRGELNTGSSYRDMNDPYGVVPFPKFDEDQEKYGTVTNNGASMIAILASLPDERTEMIGATIELMGAESYKQVTPVFYDVMLKSKFSDDPRDAEMYDLILESFSFSFGFIYSTACIAGVGGLFRTPAIDFAQTYEANATQYETALENLIDKLEELSYDLLYGNN